MKINQQYIADLLKVSRVTVTKALQDHSDIAPETRQKVKDMAEQLGYIPNGIGRSLSTKRTHTIGIVVPKINHSFFASVIEDMYSTAAKHGYKILMMVSFENEEIEYNSVKTLLSMNVDGILIDPSSDTSSDKSFSLIEKHHKPLMFFDRNLRTFDSSGVYFDDYNLSYKLTMEMIKRGYRKFAYITGPQQINISYERLSGFKSALSDAGIEQPKSWIIKSELERDNGCDAFKLFLQTSEERPEAVLCVNDSIALGVYDACASEGLSIPEDLAVAGFGNVLISSLVQPPLTTVNLFEKEASVKAVENLIKMIESDNSEMDDEIFDGEIIMRESVKDYQNKRSNSH
ncbi:MAG: LacI family DNA-binding transcriptional regulator [Cyclobacteriaceae bacterium]